jgi:hypothetical protein
MLSYICSSNGNIIVNLDGENVCVHASHPNHQQVVEALRLGDEDVIRKITDVAGAVNRYAAGDIEVSGNHVLYRGQIVKGYLVDRILAQMSMGYGYEPMCAFLENMYDNPEPSSIEQLFPFLESCGLVLTDDGCFLAYKYVSRSTSSCKGANGALLPIGTLIPSHANLDGSYHNNNPGQVVRMPRDGVELNPEKPCAAGLHAGTTDFVGNSGDVQILVKINPKHAVSVPCEHAFGKIRCCEYSVIKEVTLSRLGDGRYEYQSGLTNVACDGYSPSRHVPQKGSLDNQTASHWGE